MAKKDKKFSETIDLSRKKEKEFDLNMNIKVAYKTGKIIYGKNQVLKYMRQTPFKMLIIANNCPKELEDQLNYFNALLGAKDNVFVHKYKGSSWELGLACAKPYMISVLGVIDPGDSELLTLKTTKK